MAATIIIEGLLIGVVVFGVAVLATLAHEKIRDDENAENKKEKYKYYDIDFDKIHKDVDNLVNREVDEYFKMHPDILQLGESYISREDIPKIISDITSRSMQSITEPFRSNMKFIYNFETDEDLIKIIGYKVGIIIAGTAARINSSMIDESTLIL